MKHDSVYAVVDLETTGTNSKEDKIIQIGCVFVQNGQVIDIYRQDINPRIKLTKQIESLTGLTNEQLASAPYFEDVAAELAQKLSNCVFVAHNIYFDYQFLSQAFVNAGFDPLTLEGVDTVELAQVFLPTLASYRLSDIADFLDYQHDRPHQADSDALVTSELLIYIENKLSTLPICTLEKIVSLSGVLGKETSDYLVMQLEVLKKNYRSLSPDIHVVNGMALYKKPDISALYPEKNVKEFPLGIEEKQKAYGEWLEVRESQSEMMDDVYQFFTEREEENKNFAIEAPTGSGKSFGYLYPMSYLATTDNPVVLSTTSILLEQQLINEAIPLVNQVNSNSLVGTMIKSSRYFIDLNKFNVTLQFPTKQKQFAIHQMSVLIWLLETQTGDLTELNLANLDHPFFRQVKHFGERFVPKNSPFYEEDFWRYLKNRANHSNVLIVNHAFLIKENFREFPWLPSSDYLIIDEAHHLPEIAEKMGREQLDFSKLKFVFHKLTHFEEVRDNWAKIKQDKDWPIKHQLVDQIIVEASQVVDNLESDIVETALLDAKLNLNEEIVLSQEQLEQLPIYVIQDIYRLIRLLTDLNALINQCRDFCLIHWDKWLPSEQLSIQAWLDYQDELETIQSFVTDYIQNDSEQVVKWLYIDKEKYQITLYKSDVGASLIEETTWFERYRKILYTGGTLSTGEHDNFLAKSLGIEYTPMVKFKGTFDYAKQARLYMPTESRQFTNLSTTYYEKYVAQTITEIAKDNSVNVLVLFTSLEMLKNVYHMIQPTLMDRSIETLAQGISGSRERILKRFTKQGGQKVLLGADSYWEGVDLPGDALELIVVVRMPFESPDRPYVKEKLRLYQERGLDGFQHYSLPKAILRLRQGIGRLIRSNEDHGAIVMLDPRIRTAKYAKKIQQALPEGLVLKEQPLKAIMKELSQFIGKSNNR
ncbi:helicase C-terminal domain-containing protein [Vagococcus xieshaowenii]|nr:helicase C-terminal domain-containing protein [Vagococcus xieshaowenii]